MVQTPLRKGFELCAALAEFLIWIKFVRRTHLYDEAGTMGRSADQPRAEGSMPIGQRILYLSVFLIASVAAIDDAHAGVTISDRRYWPNEARTSPGQPIQIYPYPYVYPDSGVAAGARITPRKKVRRNR